MFAALPPEVPFGPAATPPRRRLPLLGGNLARAAIAVLFFALVGGILSYNLLPEGVTLEVGSVASQDFTAPRTAVDRYLTAEHRESAAEAVPDFYRYDAEPPAAARAALDKVSADVLAVLSVNGTPRADKVKAIEQRLPLEPAADVAAAALDLGPGGWTGALGRLRDVVVGLLGAELRQEGLDQAKAAVAAEVESERLGRPLTAYLTALGQAQLKATMLFDAQETGRRRQEAMSAVAPVTILRGQIIVRRGDVLTAHQIALLQDFGMLRARLDPRAITGSVLLAGLLVSATVVYLRFYQEDTYRNPRHLILLAVVVTFVLLVAQAVRPITGCLAPVAAGTMLIASLLNGRLALFAGVIMSLAVGLICGGELRIALVAMASGMAGVYGLKLVGQRSDLTRAGLIAGASGAFTVFAFALLSGVPLSTPEVWREMGFAVLGGVASAVLTIGTLPFYESAFGVLTAVRLLELANPNRPLLRRLLVEAPGTYHHSVVVGNLAEAAAETVDGDGLLARVGAYYHDIGKVTRPYFFIENQIARDNPHDKISPSLSTLIITSHVKDGVALAEEARVPSQVVAFIKSHHGRSLISYFYSRAAENGLGDKLEEADFRYDGPLPQTREEAIVMLADSTEAAVRAMTDPSPARIETLVRRIIRDKLVDGQLEKCDLTLKDLDRVGETFVRVLLGIFHARIAYPQQREDLIKQMKGGEAQPGGPEAAGAPEQPGAAEGASAPDRARPRQEPGEDGAPR